MFAVCVMLELFKKNSHMEEHTTSQFSEDSNKKKIKNIHFLFVCVICFGHTHNVIDVTLVTDGKCSISSYRNILKSISKKVLKL